jgi:hypothetical protein
VLGAARGALLVAVRPPRRAWTVALLSLAGAALALQALWALAQTRSPSFLLLGAMLPLAAALFDRSTPWQRSGSMAAWNLAGGWMGVCAWPQLGPSGALLVSVGWMALSPFLWPTLMLRDLVARLAERDGVVGGLARAWTVFLPAPQAARVCRRRGDPAAAMGILRAALAQPMQGRRLQETLLEAGELLLELEDPRAARLFASAVWLGPTESRPLFGLARALREESPEQAQAYVRFAQENAARALVPIGGS